MDATAILVSDWSFSKNLGQINRNLVGRFYVREDFLEIDQSETRIICGGNDC
jgi:hypothetical protein